MSAMSDARYANNAYQKRLMPFEIGTKFVKEFDAKKTLRKKVCNTHLSVAMNIFFSLSLTCQDTKIKRPTTLGP